MRFFGLGADGRTEAVPLQGNAAAVDQRQCGTQVLSRLGGGALPGGQPAQALVAGQRHRAQAQDLGLFQRMLQATLRLVVQAKCGCSIGGSGIGFQQPADHAAAVQGRHWRARRCPARRPAVRP